MATFWELSTGDSLLHKIFSGPVVMFDFTAQHDVSVKSLSLILHGTFVLYLFYRDSSLTSVSTKRNANFLMAFLWGKNY